MNSSVQRHLFSRPGLIAALGALAVASVALVPYAYADDHGQDQKVERRAIPERAPAQQRPVGRASAPRSQEPIAHQHGPAFVDRSAGAQPRGPQIIDHGPAEREHGPVDRGDFARGPVVQGHGPTAINRTPVIEQHGPIGVNRGPVVEQRGPLAVDRRGPERFENHGPADFRDRPVDRDHDFFDDRYDHGRYYPRRGEFVRELPGGYRPFYFDRRPYFFVGGVWYINGPGGYVVAAPPAGLVVSILPPFYTTVWLGGVQYFYADDVYYQWNPGYGAYVVVTPPEVDEEVAAPPPQDTADQDQLYIYPANGQSEQQQAQDRYDCYSWAKSQTGFDPTQPGGGVPPDQDAQGNQQYRRAMTACLTARGYSVN